MGEKKLCHLVTIIDSKTVIVYKEVNSKFKQTVYNLRRSSQFFLDETDVDSSFHRNMLDIALIDNRIVRVCKGSNKIIFAFKLLQFCNLKNQQRFTLEVEVSVSLKELAAFLNTLPLFLEQNDKAVNFPALYTLPKSKQRLVFNLFKDKLFGHYFQDIKEHATDRYVFLFVLSVTRSVVSPSKSFNMSVSRPSNIFLLRIRNHVLPYLVGPTAFEKKTKSDYQTEKLSALLRQCISQSKLSTKKAVEANIEPVPIKAKILPYMQ